MTFKVLTIFPQFIENALGESILGRARRAGIIKAEALDIRAFSDSKHKNTDDAPFGGGAGMVMTPQPIRDAILKAGEGGFKGRRIYLSPRGSAFNQRRAEQLASLPGLILLCGHYEGVDQRVLDAYIDEEISVGDYVLTGGELGALIVIDAVARLIPGVLGSDESSRDESFSGGLLEYPQYTRPRVFEGREAPQLLTGGNQKLIERWRRDEALKITHARRPELLKGAALDRHDRALLRALDARPPYRVFTDAFDDELISALGESAQRPFARAEAPLHADGCVYMRSLPPESVLSSGRPVYVNAALKPGGAAFTASPARFSPPVLALTGDEGIKRVSLSGLDAYEFSSCAAALLPLKRALPGRADYGKGRSAAFLGGGERRLDAEFFDGGTTGGYVARLPNAFIKALGRYLISGQSPISAQEAENTYKLFRLCAGKQGDEL